MKKEAPLQKELLLCMENGQIVEKGKHKDLMTTDGKYARLYKLMTTKLDGALRGTH